MQLLALTLLICDAAAGLAGRLAGSLAFAATAILRALTQIAGFDGLDVLHNSNLHKKCSYKWYHIPRAKSTRFPQTKKFSCTQAEIFPALYIFNGGGKQYL